ncbi:MAG: PKD domain-containing protein, partial [Bacteroidia bacterium]|nr:PKD domain-containing protein [Bacteroidia bacterium]
MRKPNFFLLIFFLFGQLAVLSQITPPDSIAGLKLWLSADTLVTYNAGNQVSLWQDRSGNNNHCSQSSSPNQPIYVLSEPTLCGKPSVYFNTGSFLNFSSQIFPVHPFTLFMVVKATYNQNGVVLSTLGGAGHGIVFMYLASSEMRFFSSTPTAGPNFYDNTLSAGQGLNFSIYSFTTNADSAFAGANTLYINTQVRPPFSFQLDSTQDSPLTLGGLYPAGGPLGLDGNVAEIILYNGVLADTSRIQVENYLHDKYAPAVNLGPDVILISICPDTLDAGPCFTSYNWNGSSVDTTQKFVVTRTGDYSVDATDIFGFFSSDSVHITFPLNQLPTDTLVCFGNTVFWDTYLDSSLYSFHWSSTLDTTLSEIYLTQTGDHSVFVRENSTGCLFYSDTVHLLVDTFSLVANLGTLNQSLCSGNLLQLVTGAGQAQTYSWTPLTSGDDSLPVHPVTTSGWYFLTVVDTNGCSARDSVNVTITGVAPTADFLSPVVCIGDPANFSDALSHTNDTLPIISRNWNFGDPGSGTNDTSSSSTPVHIFSAAGTYQVTLTVSTINCSKDTVININVYPKPVANFTYVNPCSLVPVSFYDASDSLGIPLDTAQPYQWNFGDPSTGNNNVSILKNPTHIFSTSGNFSVTHTITNIYGCDSTVTFIVPVNQSAIVSFTPAPNNCIGQPMTFTVLSPASAPTWFWNFGDGSIGSSSPGPVVTHLYAFPGTYTVTLAITTSDSCSSSSSLVVTVNERPNAFFKNTAACENTRYQFSDSSWIASGTVTGWNWSFPGGATDTVRDPYFIFSDSLLYPVQLIAISNAGCKDTITRSIKVY